MADWNTFDESAMGNICIDQGIAENIMPVAHQEAILENQESPSPVVVCDEPPAESNFLTLQDNLQNCLAIIDHEVMKGYVPSLQNCSVIPIEEANFSELEEMQFFHIAELTYEEDEFSVHKLATVFNALSNKPCTLALMIQSDGQCNSFYLGVRSRDSQYSTGTMRQLLEQSLLGLFPGSSTEDYWNETLQSDVSKLDVQCVSSVTCIADYKQEKQSLGNKEFVQGLEKFVLSMQGKAFTAVCIANNLAHGELVATRKEYERIFTTISPFANMQYNFAQNTSLTQSNSDTTGTTDTTTQGNSTGIIEGSSEAIAHGEGTQISENVVDTSGENISVGEGVSHTAGTSDGTNDAVTTTTTDGTFEANSAGGSVGVSGVSANASKTVGTSASVSRGKTHGTSHTDSVSDTISKNLTRGINTSRSIGITSGINQNHTETLTQNHGTQYSENQGQSFSQNYAQTKALTDTFGTSQAITLNAQNKALTNTLDRLEKQLHRLDECESIGMWDFAAYFLGESAAEAESAASVYRSLVSGNQSGLEIAAVNTWAEENSVEEITKYVTHFLHPVFSYVFKDGDVERQIAVDATALASTNELAIQLGLPRKSVKGLPVIEYAPFAQEVLTHTKVKTDRAGEIELGVITHLGRETDTATKLDLQSLSMHTFVTGSTGAGKSNTVYQLLSQLQKNDVHFLVVEPAKGEYKNVFGNDDSVSVYGTNPLLMNLLRINPFSFPKEVHIYEHLDRLVEIFNVCWPMYAAMPAILKDAMERAYVKAGWDLRKSKNKYDQALFPNFIDVLQQIDQVMDASQYSSDNKGDYKGALSTRLRSLTNGINSLVFTADELTPQALFDENVIVDLSRVGSSETKALIMGLLVMKLQEYRIASHTGMNAPLKHVTVLEEAHNLLKRTSTEQAAEGSNLLGKSVEMLTNAIAEMRTYGEGFIIADQSPGLLDVSVIRNTNTKIIMRLPEYSDRELVGRAAGLSDKQIIELSRLDTGVAAIYQNNWLEAVLCKVHRYNKEDEFAWTEETEKPDIKGKIISRFIAKDIYNLIDCVDNQLISSNLPATAKCKLIEYVNTPVEQRLDAAAAVAYELFCAESAFAQLANSKLEYEQQRILLAENLTPSITPLPDECIQVILYLVTYWNAQTTKSPESRALANNLIKFQEVRK